MVNPETLRSGVPVLGHTTWFQVLFLATSWGLGSIGVFKLVDLSRPKEVLAVQPDIQSMYELMHKQTHGVQY